MCPFPAAPCPLGRYGSAGYHSIGCGARGGKSPPGGNTPSGPAPPPYGRNGVVGGSTPSPGNGGAGRDAPAPEPDPGRSSAVSAPGDGTCDLDRANAR